MARTAVLGLPRIGPRRELKFALEAYWAGRTGAPTVERTARSLRCAAWRRAADAGIDVIPSGDFSLYDHVLDTAWGLGALPERFAAAGDGLDGYFAAARGTNEARPLEMTKWFDTNYHYLVPELRPGQRFATRPDHWVQQLREAAGQGVRTRPVLLGPLSFCLLAKGLRRPLEAFDELIGAYAELLSAIGAEGAEEVQIDEPCLALDRTPDELRAFASAWRTLERASAARLCVTTYFTDLPAAALAEVAALEPGEMHVDLVRAPGQLPAVLEALSDSSTRLSLGVVDGRNVWATDGDRALKLIDTARAALGEDRVTIASSCSLLHLPYSTTRETALPDELRPWLAFAEQRLDELTVLGRAARSGADRDELLADSRAVARARRRSAHVTDTAVRERAAAITDADHARASGSDERRSAQHTRQPLPELPTTSIGSFPQTEAIRAARRDLRSGTMGAEDYEAFMRARIAEVIAAQEELGLDVLVHGEPERSDMVEYFGERLAGFAFSEHGWVQSYGSRCVKPPILYGDVSRPRPITVGWWRHAQSLTERPVKGMLTGPVTMMQWSFVRDDQPEPETCRQLALAIADEVADLEAAGAFAIQVDEAALREGLPLRVEDRDEYLRWAIDCFRLTAAGVRDDTQIHTHMCYSEFNDMMEHIARLDADVLSIEASRSDMEVLDAFADGLDYPNDIGPGVYDIHSPRVPTVEELERLLKLAERRIGRERLWVNPDCGLKTRRWEEVRPALANLVEAATRRRTAVTSAR